MDAKDVAPVMEDAAAVPKRPGFSGKFLVQSHVLRSPLVRK